MRSNDHEQIKHAAEKKLQTWPISGALAHAETLLLLEEREEDGRKALNLLRPILEADVRASA